MTIKSTSARMAAFLASELFFRIVIAFFLFNALWFVVSAQYPMAFDENVHFGLTQLHAQQWLPFFTEQPPDAAQYGPAVRDPSYLYHFLMSIPYRLISAITDNWVAHVIVLRLLNVGLFVWGMFLFRRLLLRLDGSRALAHTALLLFTFVPIVPFLAAHINYDTLFVICTLLGALFALDVIDGFKKSSIHLSRLLLFGVALMAGVLTKYAFLPIAIVLVGFVVWEYWRRGLLAKRGVVWADSWRQFTKLSRWTVVGLGIVFVSLFGLCIERYGYNIVMYGGPNPSCPKVLSVQECVQWGPWGRDYRYELNRSASFTPDPVDYAAQWLKGMWRRSFFAINHNYANKWPLPIPGKTVIVIAVAGLIPLLVYGWGVVRTNKGLQIVLVALAAYAVALTVQIYTTYERTGVPVAINGRYFIPFLPMIFVLYGAVYRRLFERLFKAHAAVIKSVMLTLVVLLLLQGGGVVTWMVQSKAHWYWQSPTVITMNETAQKLLKPIVYGSNKPK